MSIGTCGGEDDAAAEEDANGSAEGSNGGLFGGSVRSDGTAVGSNN